LKWSLQQHESLERWKPILRSSTVDSSDSKDAEMVVQRKQIWNDGQTANTRPWISGVLTSPNPGLTAGFFTLIVLV